MRDHTMRVGTRTDRESYIVLQFAQSDEAEQVWHLLGALHRDGKLDERCSVAVFDLRVLLLAVPADSDLDAQIEVITVACREQCELNLRRRDLRNPDDYAMYELAMQAARSQSN